MSKQDVCLVLPQDWNKCKKMQVDLETGCQIVWEEVYICLISLIMQPRTITRRIWTLALTDSISIAFWALNIFCDSCVGLKKQQRQWRQLCTALPAILPVRQLINSEWICCDRDNSQHNIIMHHYIWQMHIINDRSLQNITAYNYNIQKI